VEVLEPVSPAHARLGSEALARLRGRYADVLANLARRVPDEQRREQMREQAERLNPDSWVTDDEVTAGLDSYESVLASLREVAGRRRRRRRGRGTSDVGSAVGPESVDAQQALEGGEGEADADGDEVEPDPVSGD
jgi:CelD/BcsL family acetyltransferase involved in cellulose biosynthesis